MGTVRWRLVIAFLLNAAWLPVFNNELFWVALVIILAYLGALIAIYKDLNQSKTSTVLDAFLLTTGISANLSWVLVASCLNFFFCFGKVGWKNEYGVAGTPLVTIIVCVAVSSIAIERVVNGKDLMYAFVAAWAFQGVYRMQTFEDASRFPPEARDEQLAGAAGALSASVLVTMFAGAVQLSCSGGRKSSPEPVQASVRKEEEEQDVEEAAQSTAAADV